MSSLAHRLPIRLKLAWRPVIAALLIIIAVAQPACGTEDQVVFLHALQDRGYGELAVHYLHSLRDAGKLNDDLKALFEIELAASLSVAAREARAPAEVSRKLSEAEALLEAFLKRNPAGPAAARALAGSGEIEFERARLMMEASGGLAAADRPESSRRNIRAVLERSRSRFDNALAIYRKLSEKLPSESTQAAVPRETPKGSPIRAAQESAFAKERRETEEAALDCRFQSALVEYNLAQTYPAGDDLDRKQALKEASQAFDAIYQQNRTRRSGLYAHFWYGKVMEELGNRETALDAYDEVLASAPEEGRPRPELPLESLYAETEYRRLLLLAQQEPPKDVAEEAAQWVLANAPARPTDGYQGVRLEQAKALILIAAKNRDNEAMQEALKVLADVATVPSAHQREAILLRHRHSGSAGAAGLDNLNDALAVGDASAANGLWDQAVSAYARAVELGKKTPETDAALIAQYRLARAHYYSGHADAALEIADTLARSHPDRPIARAAASLAMRAASALSTTAADKKAAQKRLITLVEFVAQQWPNRPEADEARLILGTAALAQGDYGGAAEVFEAVPPTALCYEDARYLAAQAHWQRYLDEKRKPAEARKADMLSAERLQTIKILTATLKQPPKGSADVAGGSQTAVRMRIFLAETYLEANRPDQALQLLHPLIEKDEAHSTLSADLASRALGDAMRAHLAANDMKRAGETAARLAESGEDSPQTNAVLTEFLNRLVAEWKRAKDASVSPTHPSAEAMSVKQSISAFVTQLTARKNHSLAGQAILADACLELGKAAEAQAYYQEIVTKANETSSLDPASAYAVARARTRLIDALRAKKDYTEALREADRLVQENPRSFEALRAKGSILQAWAESDPKRYGEALVVWTQLRMALASLPRKPPEYYEVVYNAACCLVAQAAKSDDKHPLAEARRLLKSTMVLYPQLSGPEMVVKYQELLEKCRFLETHHL